MAEANWQTDTVGQNDSSSGGFDIWGMVIRRKWIIFLVGLVGAGLGYLQYTKSPPVYSSSTSVLVTQNESQIPVEGARTSFGGRDYLSTHMVLIKSPRVLNRAVEIGNLGSLRTFSGAGNVAARVGAGLNIIEPAGNAPMLVFSFSGPDRVDCPKVLSAVVESYTEFLKESRNEANQQTLNMIQEAMYKLNDDIQAKEREYKKFRDADDTKLLWKGTVGTNIHQSRLATIESERSRLRIQQSEIKAQLTEIEEASKNGTSREALMLMIEQTENRSKSPDGGRRTFMAGELFPLLLEEQMLLENHGPDHPKVQSVRKRIEITRNFLRDQMAAAAPTEAEKNANKPLDILAVYTESLRREMSALARREKELDGMFRSESEQAKLVSGQELKNEYFQDEIERSKLLFDTVVARLQEVKLVQDTGESSYSAEIVGPPGPGKQVAPDFSRLVGMGTIAGLMCGLVLAYLIELADKSFRSPNEVSRHLSLPVIGHIPVLPVDELKISEEHPNVDSTLVTFHDPRSRYAESYREIRTALYFSTRGKGHQLIQVTSPDPGDGKSTLCSNLAIAIAQSGKKCLLVDCDFRRPRVHRVFGLDRTIGATSVINGTLELPDSVQKTPIDNLWALCAGPRPENPSELLTSPVFEEMLEICRQKFDFVLLDTPPLLAVTDPGAVAARADGVVLNLRITRKVRPNSVRAREMLEQVGANILGVVINGIGPQNNYGYGSSSYQYASSGYGYGYKYRYTYGDGVYGQYYDEQAPEKQTAVQKRQAARRRIGQRR